MTDKPFSQACENNKHPILEKLREVFVAPGTVLEIGTGTGQHAVCFAAALPHLVWQPSDQAGNEQLCQPWLDEYAGGNILPNTQHASMLASAVRRMSNLSERQRNAMLPCCAPTSMGSFTIMYLDPRGQVKLNQMSNLVAYDCGCM